MDTNKTFNLTGLPDAVVSALEGYTNDLASLLQADLESVALVGSVLTSDFVSGVSDINSVLIVSQIDMPLLDSVAGLGKQHGKNRIRSPLIMTHEYLKHSTNAFAVEFLDMKLTHRTIFGDDILSEIAPDKAVLRQQCEREFKARIMNLTRGYVAVSGRMDALAALLLTTYVGFFPIFRAMLWYAGITPSTDKKAVLEAMSSHYQVNMSCMEEIMRLREQGQALQSHKELHNLFGDTLAMSTMLAYITDELAQKG